MLQGVPVQNLPFLYGNNLLDSWTSNTVLALSAGQCRDDTNTVDMVLSSPLAISTAFVGVNGLDQGAVANSTWYYLFLISDPIGANPTAALLSTSKTAPLMPFGYSAKRYIGAWRTNGSAQLLLMQKYGNGSYRTCWWDAPVSVLSAGTAATFTAISLVAGVPTALRTQVTFNADVKPSFANDGATFRPTGSPSTGGYVVINGTVGTVDAKVQIVVPCLLATVSSVIVPAIDYQVIGTLNLSVAAFNDYL